MQTKLELYLEDDVLLYLQNYASKVNMTVVELIQDILTTFVQKKREYIDDDEAIYNYLVEKYKFKGAVYN